MYATSKKRLAECFFRGGPEQISVRRNAVERDARSRAVRCIEPPPFASFDLHQSASEERRHPRCCCWAVIRPEDRFPRFPPAGTAGQADVGGDGATPGVFLIECSAPLGNRMPILIWTPLSPKRTGGWPIFESRARGQKAL